MKHFPFGSSTAHRTDNCQQWRKQSEGIPRQESGFAVDGTIVHGILEHWMLDEKEPDQIEGHDVTDDHRDLARNMYHLTNALLSEYGVIELEPEVQATTAPDVGGTLDLVAMAADNQMLLVDYKTGAGVQVDAENNKQILFAAANILYGDSSVSDWVPDIDSFVGVIVQPDRSSEIQVKEWSFSIDTVNEFWDTHKANIAMARDGRGELKAGTHCKFCPAQGVCPATTGQLLRMKQLDPARTADLVEVLDMIESVKDTIRAAEKLAYEQLEIGTELPGWKLVRGRPGNTSWNDEAEALKLLKRKARGKTIDEERLTSMLEKRALISPTQAKALLKKAGVEPEFLEDITHRPEPKGLTLARESDKRPAVVSADALQAALDSVA